MDTFEVLKLEPSSESKAILEQFYQNCADDGIKNNSSEKQMKINRFDRDQWWGVLFADQLVAVSGAYPCDDFEKNGWRLLFRSATLKNFRSKAGHFSRNLNHDFCYGHILPLQLEFAKKAGAEFLFFTTNTGHTGDKDSNRADEFVRRILLPLGEVELYKESIDYFDCKQNIWRIATSN